MHKSFSENNTSLVISYSIVKICGALFSALSISLLPIYALMNQVPVAKVTEEDGALTIVALITFVVFISISLLFCVMTTLWIAPFVARTIRKVAYRLIVRSRRAGTDPILRSMPKLQTTDTVLKSVSILLFLLVAVLFLIPLRNHSTSEVILAFIAYIVTGVFYNTLLFGSYRRKSAVVRFIVGLLVGGLILIRTPLGVNFLNMSMETIGLRSHVKNQIQATDEAYQKIANISEAYGFELPACRLGTDWLIGGVTVVWSSSTSDSYLRLGNVNGPNVGMPINSDSVSIIRVNGVSAPCLPQSAPH